jgi:hypothetical protein
MFSIISGSKLCVDGSVLLCCVHSMFRPYVVCVTTVEIFCANFAKCVLFCCYSCFAVISCSLFLSI